MTPAPLAEPPMPRRPARVTGAGVVLIVMAALTLLYGSIGLVATLGAQSDGLSTSPVDLVAGALAQTLIPFALGLMAGAAAFGVLRGRGWGRALAIVVGAVFLLGGVVLLWVAADEWGLPGSFSMLWVPPGVVALLVGGFVEWAVLTSGPYFADR